MSHTVASSLIIRTEAVWQILILEESEGLVCVKS